MGKTTRGRRGRSNSKGREKDSRKRSRSAGDADRPNQDGQRKNKRERGERQSRNRMEQREEDRSEVLNTAERFEDSMERDQESSNETVAEVHFEDDNEEMALEVRVRPQEDNFSEIEGSDAETLNPDNVSETSEREVTFRSMNNNATATGIRSEVHKVQRDPVARQPSREPEREFTMEEERRNWISDAVRQMSGEMIKIMEKSGFVRHRGLPSTDDAYHHVGTTFTRK